MKKASKRVHTLRIITILSLIIQDKELQDHLTEEEVLEETEEEEDGDGEEEEVEETMMTEDKIIDIISKVNSQDIKEEEVIIHKNSNINLNNKLNKMKNQFKLLTRDLAL